MNLVSSQEKQAIFAAGCFWGVEHHMAKAPGVLRTTVGYCGGAVVNPTYEEVCKGQTGHLEAVEIMFDPGLTNYETLLKLFFEIHNFSQENGQGPDLGEQYLSAVFVVDNEQKQSTENLIRWLEQEGHKVTTTIHYLETFWKAEDYHQQYYSKKRGNPYCHFRKKIFS